jgi:hypothetical protein
VIIAVTLIAAIAIAGLGFGLFGSLTSVGPVSVKVTPQIYASDSSVGVLNEFANFTVTVKDISITNQSGFVIVSSGGHVYLNDSFIVSPAGPIQVFFSQELSTIGIWEVDSYVNGVEVPFSSYSFNVVTNIDQAQLLIDQNGISQQSLITAQFSLGVASIAAATTIGLTVWQIRRAKSSPAERGLPRMRQFLERINGCLSKMEDVLEEYRRNDITKNIVPIFKRTVVLVDSAKLDHLNEGFEQSTPSMWSHILGLSEKMRPHVESTVYKPSAESAKELMTEGRVLLKEIQSWLDAYK